MRSNKKPTEPHGKQNPGKIKKDRQQQLHQPGNGHGRRRHAPSIVEEDSLDGYFYLLLKGGVCVCAAIALVYAVNHQRSENSTALHSHEPASGSSRPVGPTTRVQSNLGAGSIFNNREPAPSKPVQASPPTPVTKPENKPVSPPSPHQTKPLFETIENLFYRNAHLTDVHQSIKHQGARAFKVVHDMQGLPLTHVTRLDNAQIELVDAYKITPLQYAFLIGRMDAFALLVLEGAKLEGDLCFSFQSDVDNAGHLQSLRTSLTNILFEFPYHPLIEQLCTPAFKHELFIAYLQQHNFEKAAEMIHFRLKKLNEQAWKWRSTVELRAIKVIFSLLPPPDYILLSLGDLRESSFDFIHDIHFEWAWLQQAATKKHGVFSHYEPDALQAVLQKINAYLDCFNKLLTNIDPKITREAYIKQRASRLFIQHEIYPQTNHKNVYLDYLRTKVDRACEAHFKNKLPESELVRIQYIASYMCELTDLSDSEIYFESLHQMFFEQINAYANFNHDAELASLALVLNSADLPTQKDNVKHMMMDISQRIDNKIQDRQPTMRP